MKFMRQYLLSLLLTFTMVSGSYAAADMGNTSVISPVDASNGSGTCPSWLGSAAPSSLDDAGRCLQGALARWWENISFSITSAGTAPNFTVTYTVAPAAYRTGQNYCWTTNAAAAGTDGANVNTLGAKGLKKVVSGSKTNLAANDFYTGEKVCFAYDGTDLVWSNWQGSTPTVSGSITSSGYTQTTARILGRTTASTGAIEEITVGTGLSLSAGSLTSTITANGDVQTFTGSGTWTKPSGKGSGSVVRLQCWGAGGSGGKGSAAAAQGGGGGGGYAELYTTLASLGATETVTIGAGGIAQTSTDTAGNAGGNTTFGALLTAYGGGGGGFLSNGGGGGGGGGGGAGAGATAVAGAGGVAGAAPAGTTLSGATGGATGASGGSVALGNFQVTGAGGGGAATDASTANGVGGGTILGGGGGGAGGEDASPGPGTGGTSNYGGAGGAGAFDASAATAGSQPGGGGGGSEAGDSGAGGAGKCIVYVF